MYRTAKHFLALAIVSSIVALAFVFVSHNYVVINAQAQTKTAHGKSDPADVIATAPGWVDAKDGTLHLGVLVEGTVKEILAREGDDVPAKSVLLTLDNSQSQIDLETSQLEKQRHDSEQLTLASQLQRAKETVATLEPLVAKQAESGEDLRQARNKISDIEAQITLAKLGSQAAALQVKQAQNKLAKMEVHAPVKGQILRVTAHPGDTVAPGNTLIWFAPDGPMIVRAELDERFFDRITPGMLADVVTEFDNSKIYSARVVRVAHAIGPVQALPEIKSAGKDDRVVECILELETNTLLIGQRVIVRIRGIH